MKFLSQNLIYCDAGENFKLSKHFNSSEFEDGVSSYVLIDFNLIHVLEKMRVELNCPIQITSAFRGEAKQAALKAQGYETASGISTHQVGSAVDISTGIHSGEELEKIARKHGIRAVGVASTWIHIDMRMDKDRRWEYLKRT